MNNQAIGKLGEEMAGSFLHNEGYSIVKCNYRSRYGELDLIAFDEKAKQTVFTEVKTRFSPDFGEGAEAIDYNKIQKIILTIGDFIQKNAQFRAFSWRIDLISLKLGKKFQLQELTHLKNILDGY